MEEITRNAETAGKETEQPEKRLLIRDKFDPSDYVLTERDVRGTKNGNGLKLVSSVLAADPAEFQCVDLHKELLQKQAAAMMDEIERKNKARSAVQDFSRKHKDLIWESSSFEEYSIKHDVSGIDELKLMLPDIPDSFETVKKCCEPVMGDVIYCPYVPVQRVSSTTVSANPPTAGAKTVYGKLETDFNLSAYFQRNEHSISWNRIFMHISRFKYPRTFHLPYSETLSDDDKRLPDDVDFFGHREIVMTEKMDGENTSVYPDGFIHARSLDGNRHEWQAWLKKYIQSWCMDIPDGWRVCGENLYPRHSISYRFPDETYFFQVFGIYNEKGFCLSWDDTVSWCDMLGIRHVPVIYRGAYFGKDKTLKIFSDYKLRTLNSTGNETEGFVMRCADEFNVAGFNSNDPNGCSIAKYVSKNHVTTDSHWAEHWTRNETC